MASAMLATAVVTGGLMVWNGAWHDPGWWMTAPFVAVWCCVPYAWIGRSLRDARGHLAGIRLVSWGALAAIAVAVWVLWNYQTSAGGRGGRVFLLLPVWQGLVFAPFVLLARWLRPAAIEHD